MKANDLLEKHYIINWIVILQHLDGEIISFLNIDWKPALMFKRI